MSPNKYFSVGAPPSWTKERLIKIAVDFVYDHLAVWRDTSDTLPEAERKLNEHLSRFLDDQARIENCPFMIHHEQSQTGIRTIDLAVYPTSSFIVGAYSSIHKAIIVIEAKRLPTPGSGREREYVTGEDGKITGGIQRFKLGEHGAKHQTAAIVGYIQKHDADHFFSLINSWIEELASDSLSGWHESEKMNPLNSNHKIMTARTTSDHCRDGDLPDICLHHLWIGMRAI